VNSDQIREFKKLVGELVVSMDRVSAERELQKAILETIKETCEVDKTHARKVAKAIHANKVAETLLDSTELTDLIELIQEE